MATRLNSRACKEIYTHTNINSKNTTLLLSQSGVNIVLAEDTNIANEVKANLRYKYSFYHDIINSSQSAEKCKPEQTTNKSN